jgi:hypothetical protein
MPRAAVVAPPQVGQRGPSLRRFDGSFARLSPGGSATSADTPRMRSVVPQAPGARLELRGRARQDLVPDDPASDREPTATHAPRLSPRMIPPAGDRLAVLLAGATEPGAFSAARTTPTSDRHLEVRGWGRSSFPCLRRRLDSCACWVDRLDTDEESRPFWTGGSETRGRSRRAGSRSISAVGTRRSCLLSTASAANLAFPLAAR